jgi:predicted Holliday junction resolvase-like endonuclease
VESLKEDQVLERKLSHFTIVEVKSGNSKLTKNEKAVYEKCASKGVRYSLFRISEIDKDPASWDLSKEI